MRLFSFSDTEINYIESTTTKQWQCDDWYLHKAGFITASNCKRVFTRQEALEKNSAENATKLVQAITSAQTSLHFHKQKTMEPQNAREWGLFHEESARNGLLLTCVLHCLSNFLSVCVLRLTWNSTGSGKV